jgi:hypothetical protein
MVAYEKRAEECRRLAMVTARSEHWPAFLEMAETWDKLAALHQLGRKLRASGVLLAAPAHSHDGVK